MRLILQRGFQINDEARVVSGQIEIPHAQIAKELDDESARILDILLEELSVKQASTLAARITGKSKRVLYDAALGKK